MSTSLLLGPEELETWKDGSERGRRRAAGQKSSRHHTRAWRELPFRYSKGNGGVGAGPQERLMTKSVKHCESRTLETAEDQDATVDE